jgi:hypothetical protein
VSGVRLGDHPWVVKLLKGIEAQRPAVPRYAESWDVGLLLKLVKEWGPNEQLSLTRLRSKTVILLRIASFGRSSDISYIKRSSLKFYDTHLWLDFHTKKQKRRSTQSFAMEIMRYSEDPDICPVATTSVYLQKTEGLAPDHDFLILSIRKPFLPVGADCISKIVKNAMTQAGVDTSIFNAASLRMASASKALDKGASVDAVMRIGQWSSFSVFQRFYNRSKNLPNVLNLLLN